MCNADIGQRPDELRLADGGRIRNAKLAAVVAAAGVNAPFLGEKQRVAPAEKARRLMSAWKHTKCRRKSVRPQEKAMGTHRPAATAVMCMRESASIFRGTMHVCPFVPS